MSVGTEPRLSCRGEWKYDGRVRHRRILLTVALALALAATALAQYGGPRGPFHEYPNIPYDGRFTFARIKYQTAPGGYWYGGWPGWGHGYPLSEQNLMSIMRETTYLAPHVEEINALAFDDPALFRYPIAYVIEPDWWSMTESEAVAMRTYMQKGGFIIVDDFKPMRRRFPGWSSYDDRLGVTYGSGWSVLETYMKRVFPEARFYDLDATHPIFHSFFEIDDLDVVPQIFSIGGRPVFRGLFEDNDPSKRLQMVVNYNTDVSQFWEWSSFGLRPVSETNEAYKIGVNYVIYGLSH
jgi:Domain of unknown function (DUF4159)